MACYSTGSVTVTTSSAVVTGSGTAWDTGSAVEAGDLFVRTGDAVAYSIASVDSDTQVTLSSVYGGVTGAALAYGIYRDFTTNAGLTSLFGGDRADWPTAYQENLNKQDDWALGWNRTPFACTYSDADTFTCTGDKTAIFTARMRLKIVHAGGTTYHNVVTSSYGSPTTTVDIDGSAMTSPISRVYHATISMGSSGAFPSYVEMLDTGTAYYLVLASDSTANFTADRTLTLDLGNADRNFKPYVTATDMVLGRSTAGAGNIEEIACTAAGRALLDDANATAQRVTLGLPVAGSVVQVVNYQTGAVATGSTLLPADDTIPQNNEGNEYMTLAITPTSATNKLKIDVVMYLSSDTAARHFSVALFQDATASALAAMQETEAGVNYGHNIKFTHYMTSGTASETTFKVRAGPHNTATLTFNGLAAGRGFGGVMSSSITITEIAAS